MTKVWSKIRRDHGPPLTMIGNPDRIDSLPGRAFRWVLHVLCDSLFVTFAIVLAIEGSNVVANGYLSAGMYAHMVFDCGERFANLWIPLFLLTCFFRVISRAGTRLRVWKLSPRFLSAALALGMLALLVVFRHPISILAIEMAPDSLKDFLLERRLRWKALDHQSWILLILLGITPLAVLQASRSRWPDSRTLNRWIPLFTLVCVGSLFGAHWAFRTKLSLRSPNQRNVVLIVLDTVSARHLRSRGAARDPMPELEALMRSGRSFPNAYSVAPWTLPSHASMFTGLDPMRHGATQESMVLDPRHHTLAEVLRNEGFHTFAAVGNPIVSSYTGLEQGFSSFLPTWSKEVQSAFSVPGEHVNNVAALRFLDGLESDAPFFLFLNYIEAHLPYEPPEALRENFLPDGVDGREAMSIDQDWTAYYAGLNRLTPHDFEVLNALYDAELALVSRAVGDLLDDLRERGVLENTTVILTSDHGENIGDHGHMDHAFNLYDSLLHVPFLVLGADVPEAEVDPSPATSIDVFPTLLHAAQSSHRAAVSHGRDLLADWGDEGEAPEEWISHYFFPSQALSMFPPEQWQAADEDHRERLSRFLRRLHSLRTREWKLIWSSDGRHELFDLAEDLLETKNVAEAHPVVLGEMIQRLRDRLSALRGAEVPLEIDPHLNLGVRGFEDLDPETAAMLRSLGYVR